MSDVYLSIVIPVYNEQENIKRLYEQLVKASQQINRPYEIIFIDDGSTDQTIAYLKQLENLTIVCLRKHFGQSAALDAGFKLAQGETIISLDGDLQNDPADIPRLLNKLEQGWEVVCGWRWPRKDTLTKRFISRGADFLRKILINDKIHDSGCTLRAYKKECLERLDLYGEMHRFIPALLALQGFKVTEIKVNHRPRVYGQTKYNWLRTIKGFVDIINLWFWKKYAHRPLHLFGGGGLLLFILGFVLGIYLLIARAFFDISLQNRIWPLMAVLLILTGIQLFVSGILADILNKNYYLSSKNRPYSIKEIIKQ